ncbi:metal ABC transporter solute-binding protein, Zn/Mn family [Bifidobacterium pullorum]|nr:zinc ABC transporter substrate-binding protein [Bifidobacterium pullorum]
MQGATHRWNRIAAVLAACGLIASMGACGQNKQSAEPVEPPAEPAGPITVVASVNQWGSLAEQIGGDDVAVTSIVDTTAVDAHDFEPQPADMAALQDAQVVVSNGAGYDAWATKSMGPQTASVSAAETVGASEGDNPHLWFSKDARNGMATELADAFSRILPDKKDDFQKRLDQWQEREQQLEDSMDAFRQAHPDATYAATESVAYYLLSDLGFEDLTPEGYAQASANESEPAPADLQQFQELVESQGVDLLVNNVQQGGDAANMITGTAGRANVPVFDVSEQMPEEFDDPTDWIASLVETISGLLPAGAPSDADDADEADSTADDAAGEGTGSADGQDTAGDTSAPSNEGQQDPGR